MQALRRHRLARLSSAGWDAVLARPWEAPARECLAHWATHQLPMVVTRQSAGAVQACGLVALGLPAPGRWARTRLAVHVPCAAIAGFDEFPEVDAVLPLMAPPARAALRDLQAGLAADAAPAHVYGSHGWQVLSGLDHLRAGSDLDLWIGVRDAAQADAVAARLHRFPPAQLPRLDGELVFASGAAVAWREWVEWRAGRARAVLVKRLEGASLEHDLAWCACGGSGGSDDIDCNSNSGDSGSDGDSDGRGSFRSTSEALVP